MAADKLSVSAQDFPFVVSWHDPQGRSRCTGSLITPNHIITVAHCTVVKIRDPKQRNTVKFRNGIRPVKTFRVEQCWRKHEVSVCRLASQVDDIEPVTLSPEILLGKSGKWVPETKIWTVGMSGGFHARGPKRLIYRTAQKLGVTTLPGGSSGMVGGDSGGPWLNYTDKRDEMVIYGLIEGGGRGWQPAFFREEIDNWTDGQVHWSGEPKPKLTPTTEGNDWVVPHTFNGQQPAADFPFNGQQPAADFPLNGQQPAADFPFDQHQSSPPPQPRAHAAGAPAVQGQDRQAGGVGGTSAAGTSFDATSVGTHVLAGGVGLIIGCVLTVLAILAAAAVLRYLQAPRTNDERGSPKRVKEDVL